MLALLLAERRERLADAFSVSIIIMEKPRKLAVTELLFCRDYLRMTKRGVCHR